MRVTDNGMIKQASQEPIKAKGRRGFEQIEWQEMQEAEVHSRLKLSVAFGI